MKMFWLDILIVHGKLFILIYECFLTVVMVLNAVAKLRFTHALASDFPIINVVIWLTSDAV